MIDECDIELIAKYLEGALTDEEFEIFEQRLRDDAAVRERLRAELNLESALQDTAAADARLVDLWNGPPAPAVDRRRRSMIRTGTTVAILVAVGLAIALVLPFLLSEKTADAGVATLRYRGGEVVIVDSQGTPRKVEDGAVIRPDDKINTLGGSSFATIRFEDGTRVVIAGNSSITVGGSVPKRITVLSGTISANVSEQPAGSPMVIVTPNDSVEVLGTEFSLEASRNHTDVRVTKGQVRVTRSKDGRTVVVPAGKRVVSDPFAANLVLRDGRNDGVSWVEDFEQGLPDSWGVGRHVQSGLPAGSRGGVRSAYFKRYDAYLITTQHHWVDGLFSVHADTRVQFRFKMTRPDWHNIFFLARTNDDSDPVDLFLCNTAPFRRAQPGKWYTLSIPISRWKRKDETGGGGFVGPSPIPGEVVYEMSWSSRRVDHGLVIDRIRVTRGGPDRIVMTPVERP